METAVNTKLKELQKANWWKRGVVALLLVMSGMYMENAQTAQALQELKVSVNKSATGTPAPSAEGKARGQQRNQPSPVIK